MFCQKSLNLILLSLKNIADAVSLMVSPAKAKTGFCLYVTSLAEGKVPIEFDGDNKPVIYPSLFEAQKAIAEYAIDRLEEFRERQRDFDDAFTVEEYVVEVEVRPDGGVKVLDWAPESPLPS